MAVVALLQVPVTAVGGLLTTMARQRISHGFVSEVQSRLVTAQVIQLVASEGAGLAIAYGLATIAALPAWTGARRPARAALALCVFGLVSPFVSATAGA